MFHVPSAFIVGAHVIRDQGAVILITGLEAEARPPAYRMLTRAERVALTVALGSAAAVMGWLVEPVIEPASTPAGLRLPGWLYDGPEVIAPPLAWPAADRRRRDRRSS